MRRAIQLRMTFSLGGEGGIEGKRRREHDGDEVESCVMIVPAYDLNEMDQAVNGQETCASDRGRPVHRPPRPRGQRKSGNEECRAYVLDKVRIVGAGLGCSRHACIPGWAGE